MTPTTYFLTMAAVMAVGVPLLLWWQMSRRRAIMRPLASLLDGQSGEMKGIYRWLRLDGRYHGRAAAFRHRPGGRYSPPRFEILLDCQASLSFRVGQEGAAARFAKWLHVMKDVETEDPGLDEAFTFQSSEPERLVGWIRSADGVRDAIVTLLSEPLGHSVVLRDSRLRYSCKGWAYWLDPEDARELLEALRTLAESAERA